MRIGRTIPPAASPLTLYNLISGVRGLMRHENEIERFRKELKEHFRVKHCFLVSSGKAALNLILLGVQDIFPKRNEVLIPAFCCYSLPSAIIRAGMKTRLCDMDIETLDFDFLAFDKIISGTDQRKGAHGLDPSKLLAVVSIHPFGLPADIGRVRRAIADPEVTVIEDAAQVMGAEVDGRKIGTIGDVGFFSLGRGKPLSTVEGGVIVTNRDDIADSIERRLEEIPSYSFMEVASQMMLAVALMALQRPSLFWIPKSIPFLRVGDTIFDPDFKVRQLSPFQAGLSRGWQNKLAAHSLMRRRTAEEWDQIDLPDGLAKFSLGNGMHQNFLRFPIRVKQSGLLDNILDRSRSEGLGIMLTYPNSINGIAEMKHEFDGLEFPSAEQLAKEILTLPIHPLLSRHDTQKIKAFLQSLLRPCFKNNFGEDRLST